MTLRWVESHLPADTSANTEVTFHQETAQLLSIVLNRTSNPGPEAFLSLLKGGMNQTT